MLKSSAPSVDSVQLTLRALAKQAKIPPRTRFNRLVKMGLIDSQGNLDLSHIYTTTVGELARKPRGLRRAANDNTEKPKS
jgi:hypothetical protein